MSTSDGTLQCRLVGGPLDGFAVEEWLGVQIIVFNADQNLASPERGNDWAIYKRIIEATPRSDGPRLFKFHLMQSYRPS